MKPKFIIIFTAFCLISLSLASAFPAKMHLTGILENSTGSRVNGTNYVLFSLYNSSDVNIWSQNLSVTSDSDGIYSVELNNINVSFEDDYTLGMKVGSDDEMTPRINLSSFPYAFRANVSDNFNPNNNLTIADKLTFRLGEMIDNLVDGVLKITGNLKVEGDLNVTGIIYGNGSQLTDLPAGSVTDVWVNTSGDKMSGNLGMGNNNITNVSMLGIGTASPTHALNVVGDENITGNTIIGGTITQSGTTLANTYVARNTWTTIDNYPTACGAGLCVQTVGDTLGCINPVASSDSTWTAHNSYPATCGAGLAAQAIGDTLTCINPVASSDSTWTNHNSYPAACSAGQCIQTIGDTSTCINPVASSDSSWTAHNSYPSACTTGYYATTVGDTLTCVSGSSYSARAYLNSAQSNLVKASWNTILFSQESYDIPGTFTLAGADAYYTTPIAGKYQITAKCLIFSPLVGDYYLAIYEGTNELSEVRYYLNTTNPPSYMSFQITDTLDLASSAVIRIKLYPNVAASTVGINEQSKWTSVTINFVGV